MHPSLPSRWVLLATLAALLAACAQPVADQTYTVRQIDSRRNADGAVRIKLTTPGAFAEADADLIVAYVKIVAVREATKRQRMIAQERARRAFTKMNAAARDARKPKARYLAVATEPSAPQPGRRVGKSVMLWDTQAEEIVGNNVYDIESAPPVGTVANFETRAAEYVGGGR